MAPQAGVPPTLIEILFGVPTVSHDQWHGMGLCRRWLIATRASVLPLTLFSACFALTLAQPEQLAQWLLWGVALVALLGAHATNNLLNDYVDFVTGIDQDNYFRSQYGAHVLADGLLSQSQLRVYILVAGTVSLLCGVLVLLFSVSQNAIWYAASGAVLVLFYTYPMKRWALGEVAVFAAWGPLMVVGVYAVLHDHVPAAVWWAGSTYGLGPAVVIFAKHTDKSKADRSKRVYTLPVVLGTELAKAFIALLLLLQLGLASYCGWALDLWGMYFLWLALPQAIALLIKIGHPPPNSRPVDYPASAWPLWYTTYAFVYARIGGFWLTVGMLCSWIWGG